MVSPKSSDLPGAALVEIRARRLESVALVAPFALASADLDRLSAAPEVRWIGQRGAPARLASGPVLVEDDGAAVPDGIDHILFLGSWRVLPAPLRARAKRLGVTSLLCRVGGSWRHPPTVEYLAKAVYFKSLQPLKPFLRPVRDWLYPSAAVRLRRAARRLGRRGMPGLVLATSFPVPVSELPAQLALPGLAGLVVPYHEDLDRLGEKRIGTWTVDSWALPAAARRVYLLGRWGVLKRRVLADAAEKRLDLLAVSCGPVWLPVPLGALRLYLAMRRHLPEPWLTDRLFRQALGRGATPADAIPGRVVIVCGSLAPGGAERQVANTLAGLKAGGVAEIQLLCDYLTPGQASRYDFYLPLVERAGVAARPIVTRLSRGDEDPALPPAFRRAARRMPAHLAADIANLYLEFRDLRPAVVHAFLDWSNVRAGMAAALAGVPRIVLSGRNVNPSHFALYQRYMDPVYRVLAQRPEIRLVNNSEAGARDYEAWLGLAPGRIGVLRNGVDFGDRARASPESVRAVRTTLGVPETAPLVGGVFRLFPEKRPILWVDAAAEIARRNPAARFVIWGQGVLEAELRRHIEASGLGGRLVLAGVTEDVLSALSALDVFMLTSFKEGTPNVVLEAQWVGTPVVAVEAGGTEEALDPGRTGWIVDPPTAGGLADAVCRLLDDPAAGAAVRVAGPAFIAARFGLGRMVDDTLAEYGFDGRGAPR
jgi:glycosyltransferase involved in cell wall biosynthesis